jgi:hypothetical protein
MTEVGVRNFILKINTTVTDMEYSECKEKDLSLESHGTFPVRFKRKTVSRIPDFNGVIARQ